MEPGHAFEVRQGSVGRGLFVRRAFGMGSRVIEYTGRKIPTSIADTVKTRYLFDLENGWTIDGTSPQNLARYVNHSCEPNCEAAIENDQIFFYALRDIAPDEEITIDYGPEYFNEFIKPDGCKCMSCRKTASTN